MHTYRRAHANSRGKTLRSTFPAGRIGDGLTAAAELGGHRSVGTTRKYLLAQNVSVPGVLGEFTQNL